jgi:hypothetical protein
MYGGGAQGSLCSTASKSKEDLAFLPLGRRACDDSQPPRRSRINTALVSSRDSEWPLLASENRRDENTAKAPVHRLRPEWAVFSVQIQMLQCDGL